MGRKARSAEMTTEHRTRLDTWIDEGATPPEIRDRLADLGYDWSPAVIWREIGKRRDTPPPTTPSHRTTPVFQSIETLKGAVLDPDRLQAVAAADLDYVRQQLTGIVGDVNETTGARTRAAELLSDMARELLDLAKVERERAK